MKFRFGRILVLLAGLSAVMFVSTAQSHADTNSYLFIAHAAPGRAFNSTGNPALPIDVSLNGTCILKGFSFGDIVGPVTAPAGSWSFTVSVANAVSPCSNPTIFSGTFSFTAGVTYVGVLSLNGSNQLQGQLFQANLSSIPSDRARLLVVNATLESQNAVLTKGTQTQTATVAANSLATFLPATGMYTGTITSGGVTETGPVDISLQQRNAYIYVIAGSTSNTSVQLLGPKIIYDVF
jgi:Domain of unknown function (DUF4397)